MNSKQCANVHPRIADLEKQLDMISEEEKIPWDNILKKMPLGFWIAEYDKINPGYRFKITEDYFEWIDVLEALYSSQDQFCMVEVGSGYGRWSLSAYLSNKILTKKDTYFVLIEPESFNFHASKKYLELHGVNPKKTLFINAAIDCFKGKSYLMASTPYSWYGQCLVKVRQSLFQDIKNLLCKWVPSLRCRDRFETVDTLVLSDVLENYEKIDLLDMDIQGREVDVIPNSMNVLNLKVKRVHIGTHSREIENVLFTAFSNNGWIPVRRLPCLQVSNTEFGEVYCNDGIESWTNPRLQN